jgi:hypothetical protein
VPTPEDDADGGPPAPPPPAPLPVRAEHSRQGAVGYRPMYAHGRVHARHGLTKACTGAQPVFVLKPSPAQLLTAATCHVTLQHRHRQPRRLRPLRRERRVVGPLLGKPQRKRATT